MNPDGFYGVPEGATKLGIISQYKWGTRNAGLETADTSMDGFPITQAKSGLFALPMGRGNPKEHGEYKDKYFIGEPKGKIVLIEDVITTGGSLIREVDRLNECSSAEIIAVLSLTDRREKTAEGKSVSEILADLGVDYYPMSNAPDLLPKAYERYQPGKGIARKVEEYFEEYGLEPLKILDD